MLIYKLKYLFRIYFGKQNFPKVVDIKKVGKYPMEVELGEAKKSSFGTLLEYRVWEHRDNGDDICHVFDNIKVSTLFSFSGWQFEPPIALVKEKNGKISEWAIDWISLK